MSNRAMVPFQSHRLTSFAGRNPITSQKPSAKPVALFARSKRLMYSYLKVTPPKGGKTRRSLERQIHLTVVTPVLLLLYSYVLANQLLVVLTILTLYPRA